MQRMDPWLREVFELLALGHTFEEIAETSYAKAGVLRSKYSKKLKDLVERIACETRAATNRVARSLEKGL